MKRVSWLPYIFLGLVTNAAVGGAAYYYLETTPPTYTSTWAVTLPSLGSSTNINLPGIGGAYSQVRSPYDGQAGDPRENYRFIASSDPVRNTAAESINLLPGEFGRPRIEVVGNTTLMTFEMNGDTPQEAYNKAIAHYRAFESRLDQLRIQEATERDASVAAALSNAQQKLEESQRRLSEYKAQTGLASDEQVTQLSVNIEGLRRQRAELIAQQQQTTARLRELSTELQLSASQANDAFVLKADQLFDQYRQNYSEATSTLNVLTARYGPNHPTVVRERRRQEAAQAAMFERSQELLGRPADQVTLAQLNLGSSTMGASARETLFQSLVQVQVDQQGLQAGAQELTEQILQLEQRLGTLAQYSTTLDALRRDLQISEAVFSSTLASLDAGRSNIFGSYPRIQLLTDPSLPDGQSSPNKKLVFLGAALCMLFINTGLFALWLRQRAVSRRRQLKQQTEKVEFIHPESAQLNTQSRSEILDLQKNI
ncbi:hypothetical protein H6G20_03365 [Desertifilum sp. FACHB-1129]|uniref:Tyrosine kinase G-rich domain-containing protein n=3 Tax=Cyanophyceae TaxID=3028117 RepID=A0A1E5QPP0_9CYAN|nr:MULTISPECIES: hypothetical protein [Cyanophyceae]MDA0209792.1 hypothetical protein [Cyanobacteria bacterium FC1]MDI9635990.1 hypothetical protein [Geitlerinema splendidum]MBD2310717.1 hypothetical protein [Desertifilum sp. FACHB-1129]MBD2320754.1 hypothetical protein [Desertifilum sp. FACHB-866]MBD2330882.1 hypothetical protein [Desertifilum sp. FACHB-868]